MIFSADSNDPLVQDRSSISGDLYFSLSSALECFGGLS